MESSESIVTQVERFEDYCLKKRRLEGDIESALASIDKDAVEAVEHAECELENTKRECAEIEALVERARRGDFDRGDKFLESGRQSPLYAMDEPIQPRADIQPSPATSPSILASIPTSTAGSDDFSVVSNPQKEAPGPSCDNQSILNSPGPSEDHSSDDFLTLLVQRYTDICYERRTIQEEVENRLERKERVAVEKLTCAKIALESTRQKAVEIVAALNEASGGDSMVNLPAGVLGSIDAKAINPGADGACAYVLVSGLVKVHEHATPTPPLKETPLTVSALCLPKPDTIHSSTVEHLSQSILKRKSAAEIPAATPLSTPVPLPQPHVTTTQHAIFTKYDNLMIAAKAAGSGLSMPKVPWPLYTPSHSQYPLQNVTAVHLVDSKVTDFVEGYFRWKGWNLKVEGELVLADWVRLNGQVPERKPGGKACMERVVSILRVIVQS